MKLSGGVAVATTALLLMNAEPTTALGGKGQVEAVPARTTRVVVGLHTVDPLDRLGSKVPLRSTWG